MDGFLTQNAFFVKTIVAALRSPKFQACHLFGVKVETGTYLFPIEAEC